MSWINLAFLGIGVSVGLAIARWVRLWQRSPSESASGAEAAPTDPSALTVHPPSDWQKQLQQAQLAYHLAHDMGQLKGGFLARTSHELRSPLNSIISLHQLILSDLCESPEEEREFVAQAHAAALRMLDLLDELIQVSKVAHGSEQMQIQPVQLKSLLEEVYRLTHLQAKNRNLRLHIEPPDSTLYVLADPQRLRQVLVNLVETPINLMPEGHIWVKTQVLLDAKQVCIWVEDERPADAWIEPVDLLRSPEISSPEISSPEPSERTAHGLTLMTNQMVMELMQGRLEVLATPISAPSPASSDSSSVQSSSLTRIQCVVPLANTD